ncbi:MAG: RNA repair transcriptional activator RtcR family protein [Desulfobaccales bacterium]
MRILLTFSGFHDPYTLGLIGQEEQPGPIISLIRIKDFDHVILFSTPNTKEHTSDTKDVILSLNPRIGVAIRDVPLIDPTDYLAILQGLRRHIREIIDQDPVADYFVAVASGTPQMHACWLLLVAGGELPARLLNIRPPRFVTREAPLVSEIDVTSPEFPLIRANISPMEIPDIPPPDLQSAIRKLGIVGDHPAMRQALETAALLAPSHVPLLILGETGTGKELFAHFIHLLSGRPSDRFIPVNCAAIPQELVESLLFGHKKGAFTGALSDQVGKFDLADNGTLFLDELGDLPSAIQAKLLRVIQDSMVEPVGARKPHPVDVRIIAATNQDLRRAVQSGKFRGDLYYRLNVGEIRLPPLRDRRSDIPPIALSILDRINANLRRPKRLAPGALTRLQGHSWPGNVRDLENVLERSARLTSKEVLEADDLLINDPIASPDPLAMIPEPFAGFSLEEFLAQARQSLVLRAMEIAQGNQSAAARLLGVSPQAVHKFLKKMD